MEYWENSTKSASNGTSKLNRLVLYPAPLMLSIESKNYYQHFSQYSSNIRFIRVGLRQWYSTGVLPVQSRVPQVYNFKAGFKYISKLIQWTGFLESLECFIGVPRGRFEESTPLFLKLNPCF